MIPANALVPKTREYTCQAGLALHDATAREDDCVPSESNTGFRDLHHALESALRHAAEQSDDRPTFLRQAAAEISDSMVSTFDDDHGGVVELGVRAAISAALSSVLPRLLAEYEQG